MYDTIWATIIENIFYKAANVMIIFVQGIGFSRLKASEQNIF